METMATTQQKVEKALNILRHHDFFWVMADYTNPAYGNAYGSMRAFVELIATINDRAIVKALRELWMATCEYIHKTMFGSNDEAKATFKARENELMAIIRPEYAMAA